MARRLRPGLVGLAVLLVSAPVLALARHVPAPPLPAPTAIHDAVASQQVRQALGGRRWTSVTATPLDSHYERVSFHASSRVLVQAAVRSDGVVTEVEGGGHDAVPYGDWIAYEPAVLAALAAMFVLATAVAPWRRVRNLDVIASLSLVLPVLLFEHDYVSDSVLAAVPALLYLAGRCTWRGLGPARPPSPATPLFDVVCRDWGTEVRVRLLRLLVLALAGVYVMVAISSPGAVDVVYAAMEGATKIVDGLLPYGHMPGDVLHGDTYPILSYAVYAPLAWFAPVTSVFSSVDAALALAALAVLAAAAALYRVVAGPLGVGPRPPEAEEAGLQAVMTLLCFPPLLIVASTGTTDVVLGAILAAALILWRRPAASTAALAVAGWFKLAPFALVPVWLAPLRGRRLASAVGALAAVSAATLGLVIALGGLTGLTAMAHDVAYQFDRSSLQSPWAALGLGGWQPVGQAAVLALVAAAATRLWRDPELAADGRRIAALSAAILIALQLAANYWAFLYLAWIVPFLAASVLAPEVVELSAQAACAPAAAARVEPLAA